MRKLTYFFSVARFCAMLGLATLPLSVAAATPPTIGIIVPLAHKAMTEIVAGFSETLKQVYGKPVIIKVENAQNDPNLERSIILQMHANRYALVAPIGVDATEMTLASIHDQPVVSIASDLTDKARHALSTCNVAIVHDDLGPVTQMQFIHAVYPKLTHITLVHSAANKVFPDVAATIAAGKAVGITVDQRMAATLPELMTVADAMPENTQAIFVLKDSLIVSGVATLEKVAIQRRIPLITSDNGSVEAGAGFALGVHERDIGVEAAKLAAAILNGQAACTLPIVEMHHLTVFINQKVMQATGQSIAPVIAAATRAGYKIDKLAKPVGVSH